jgi:hypothetical protein
MAWTDEQKTEVIEAYEAAEPTAETSMDIVTDLAAQFDQSVNGVRIILSRAGVYVKKESAANAKSGGAGGGSKRVSKADSQEALSAAIEAAGATADESIISKLTGKAAIYLTEVINGINSD